VKQTQLLGVLYLENNLASHVFTAARISLVELLASGRRSRRLWCRLREAHPSLPGSRSTSPSASGPKRIAFAWRDQGKPDEARDLLAPVYGWFIEGFDTLDLKEAKALLDALAS
jgi:hypothetical protein